MSTQRKNKQRQVLGRRSGRVFFVPPSLRKTYGGMFYKQSFTYNP